jgi:para-aminobenzoate synthetase / 4-amino-4-deoxychorismate lyase
MERVREGVAAGSTYQVNLTFPFYGSFSGDGIEVAEEILSTLLAPGEAPYAALLEGSGWAVLSLSPELFFERCDGRVTMRPMKGTRPRGRFGDEDRRRAGELAGSAKDRAENLMIVDMVRNDLGRIARPGTVAVVDASAVERYPTVWQMTSTVTAGSEARLPELFGALFPCASVTGAPKPATMRFIRELETEARGVYCGAVGRVEPGGRARFAVAIRTLEIDLAARSFRYGVGAGITWDSDPEEEWRIDLIETMLWKPDRGIELLDLHLERLAGSAEYFGFETTETSKTGKASMEGEARTSIAARCAGLPPRPHKVRLLLSRRGELRVEAEELLAEERRAWRIAVAQQPSPSMEVFAFHKTTLRRRYDAAWNGVPAGVDEVVLVNEHGELTEGTRTNLFVEIDGGWLTPPREAGLLAGVFRESLLRSGRAAEATLYPRDLARAHRIRLGNALRGWIPVELPVLGPGLS